MAVVGMSPCIQEHNPEVLISACMSTTGPSPKHDGKCRRAKPLMSSAVSIRVHVSGPVMQILKGFSWQLDGSLKARLGLGGTRLSSNQNDRGYNAAVESVSDGSQPSLCAIYPCGVSPAPLLTVKSARPRASATCALWRTFA